jgi:hypothetical protein
MSVCESKHQTKCYDVNLDTMNKRITLALKEDKFDLEICTHLNMLGAKLGQGILNYEYVNQTNPRKMSYSNQKRDSHVKPYTQCTCMLPSSNSPSRHAPDLAADTHPSRRRTARRLNPKARTSLFSALRMPPADKNGIATPVSKESDGASAMPLGGTLLARPCRVRCYNCD